MTEQQGDACPGRKSAEPRVSAETEPYYADSYVGHGIRVQFDPIDRTRTDLDDNVMGIYHEEQVLDWELFREEIGRAVQSKPGTVDFLDVGTGSGFWAIIVSRHFGGKIIAIDRSVRAVETAWRNALLNDVTGLEIRNEAYCRASAPAGAVKAIYLNPPYHIYPKQLEPSIPLHARGGPYGFEEFKSQLLIAKDQLAKGGKIFFHHMCLGTDKPEFERFIPEIVDGASILYYNVFHPIQTTDFLSAVYGTRFNDFTAQISKRFPKLFFCDGSISIDEKSEFSSKRVAEPLLKGRTWDCRVVLHREIAKHAFHTENVNG